MPSCQHVAMFLKRWEASLRTPLPACCLSWRMAFTGRCQNFPRRGFNAQDTTHIWRCSQRGHWQVFQTPRVKAQGASDSTPHLGATAKTGRCQAGSASYMADSLPYTSTKVGRCSASLCQQAWISSL